MEPENNPPAPPTHRVIERKQTWGRWKQKCTLESIEITTAGPGKYTVRPRGIFIDGRTRLTRTLSTDITSDQDINSDDVTQKAIPLRKLKSG